MHSMENATQLVHGTPKLAASHRTCQTFNSTKAFVMAMGPTTNEHAYLSCMASLLEPFEGWVSCGSLMIITSSSAPRHAAAKQSGRYKREASYLACSGRTLPGNIIMNQRNGPRSLYIATYLLKLGCPGVWLLGAALLPCGGCPLIGLA